MKKELHELFNGLNLLCEENEAFYFSEQDIGNYIIRSYTYRLASWSDFQLPYAKSCRGTAFVFDKTTTEWDLFCRGYNKFFNLAEGQPKEITMQERKAEKSFEKIDGSLILFGIVNEEIMAKSKTSVNSDHAIEAQRLLDENVHLRYLIKTTIESGRTPVFELVGPKEFKIVLNYTKNELIYLGAVDHITAEVTNSTDEQCTDEEFSSTWFVRRAKTYDFSWETLLELQESSDAKIEGFVVKMDNSSFVKVKVSAYCHLHFLKDNISNSSNLVPLIVNNQLDDLIGQFQDDAATISYIHDVQDKISHKFNHLVIEYKNLRGLYFNKYNEDRKEFALKYKSHDLFSYVMRKLDTSFRDIEKTAEDCVKDYIIKQCKSKSSADDFIENCK